MDRRSVRSRPVGDAPKYSTFNKISERYSFLMRGGGRVGGARYSCWCEAHNLAFHSGAGMNELLDVAACKRRHLLSYQHRGRGTCYGYEEGKIECTQAAGQQNAKTRAKALWKELKRVLKPGKFGAAQARELWSTEEQVHMRPGHFWALQFGDAGDLLADPSRKGTVVLKEFSSREYWPPNEGDPDWKDVYRGIPRHRYDPGECALLLRCYVHRTADDPEGLTFVRWQEKPGEILVLNSSELRAVEGRQACDFKLTPPRQPKELRQQQTRAKKKAPPAKEKQFDPKMRFRLERELDRDTRMVCDYT